MVWSAACLSSEADTLPQVWCHAHTLEQLGGKGCQKQGHFVFLCTYCVGQSQHQCQSRRRASPVHQGRRGNLDGTSSPAWLLFYRKILKCIVNNRQMNKCKSPTAVFTRAELAYPRIFQCHNHAHIQHQNTTTIAGANTADQVIPEHFEQPEAFINVASITDQVGKIKWICFFLLLKSRKLEYKGRQRQLRSC